MAATFSREDLKLEHLVTVESVQVDGEDWEISGIRGFSQDTVLGPKELQYHGRATYLVRSPLALGPHDFSLCHRTQTISYRP